MKKWFVLLSIAAATTACGSDVDKNPGVNSGSVAIDSPSDLNDALWATICDAAFNCSGVRPEVVQVVGRYPSEAACVSDVDGRLNFFQSDQYQLAVDEGRVEFDGQAATECLAALRAAFCSGGGIDSNFDCDPVYEGQVAEGGNCALGDECQGNMECSMGFNSEECFGTCGPSCGETSCDETEYCSDADLCTPRGGLGESCIFNGMCQQGLYCDFDTEVCSEPGVVAEGGACSGSTACEAGLVCQNDVCANVTFKAAGETCTLTSEVQDVCEPGSVCTDITFDATGGTGTCGPPKPLGGTCRLFFECEIALTCSTIDPLIDGECVEPFEDGEACSQDLDCKSGDCFDGACFSADPEMLCSVP